MHARTPAAMCVPPAARWDSPAIIFGGGDAGMFSAMIEGWVSGPTGSQMITWEVRS